MVIPISQRRWSLEFTLHCSIHINWLKIAINLHIEGPIQRRIEQRLTVISKSRLDGSWFWGIFASQFLRFVIAHKICKPLKPELDVIYCVSSKSMCQLCDVNVKSQITICLTYERQELEIWDRLKHQMPRSKDNYVKRKKSQNLIYLYHDGESIEIMLMFAMHHRFYTVS